MLRKIVLWLPFILISVGTMVISSIGIPIISSLVTSPLREKMPLVAPIAYTEILPFNPESVGKIAGITDISINSNRLPSLESPTQRELDLTQASNWFPSEQFSPEPSGRVMSYLLHIPSLNIKNAEVMVGGLDLSQSLIQYPGTANPGQLGAPVIFGHSVLRQFYNPTEKNEQRYMSLFSKVMTLKNEDTIMVDFDGITYTYKVVDSFEVKPENTLLLQQQYNVRQLKLVTCVPEGTYLRRGVIVAQLEDFKVSNDENTRN